MAFVSVHGTKVVDVTNERRGSLKVARFDEVDGARLVVEGALDAVTARDIESVFDALAADPPQCVRIDLEKLSLIDSSGVGAIVSLYKRLRARGGKLSVAGARGQPLAVLRLLNLDRVLAANPRRTNA